MRSRRGKRVTQMKPDKRRHKAHLTIGQLRARLAELPAEYDDCPVDTEGCDCVGPAGELELCEYVKYGEQVTAFVLTRDDRNEPV